MNTYVTPVNPTVVNEQATSDAAARVRAILAALPAAEVMPVNAEVPPLTAAVLGALPEIAKFRSQAAALPFYTADVFERLEDAVLALIWAHSRYLGAARVADDLPALYAEAVKLRELLYSDAKNLSLRGLIDPSCLEDYTGCTGYTVVATELLHVGGVIIDRWDTITGRCATTRDEVDYGCKLATHVLRLVGEREQGPAVIAEAADLRARAFTYLLKTYDAVRRAIIFLRWNEGDADEIAPSPNAGRNRRKGSKGEEEEVAEPTPAPQVAVVEKPSGPGGSPFIQ